MSEARAEDAPGASPHEARPGRGFWRNNIEALILAMSVAVLLKYFLIESYKIPTGSMQPTLMGWNDGRGSGIFDRVLVDKLSFHFRDPERFEVVVFQFPLDRSRYFVKRLVGLPGDHLRIAGGDLWLEAFDENGRPYWQALRRPQGVQEQHWFRIQTEKDWDLGTNYASWSVDDTGVHGSQAGRASFPSDPAGIHDEAVHGYPIAILERMGRPTRRGGQHPAGDLRLALQVKPQANCSLIRLIIEEGGRQHVAEIPGPGAASTVRTVLRSGELSSPPADSELRLSQNQASPLRFWNLDDRLELEWDGKRVLSLDVPPALRGPTQVHLESVDGGADFQDIELDRDLYYDSDTGPMNSWHVPADQYVVLGDNTVDSADSRAWRLMTVYSTVGEFPGSISGQRLPNENPSKLLDVEHFDSVAFTDTWGERRNYRSSRVGTDSKPAPFVPRSLMRGRALCVFWPWNPFQGISRLKWIR